MLEGIVDISAFMCVGIGLIINDRGVVFIYAP